MTPRLFGIALVAAVLVAYGACELVLLVPAGLAVLAAGGKEP